MTDPRFNPATGHGVECLCDECLCVAMDAVFNAPDEEPPKLVYVPSTGETLEIDSDHGRARLREILGPRIHTRVMDDGIKTKDGAA